MRHWRNDLFDVLKNRLPAHGNHAPTRPQSQGSYRSSRDTAARTLRAEDSGLLGLPAGHRPNTTLIDYYARP